MMDLLLHSDASNVDCSDATARRGSGSSDCGIMALQMEPMLGCFNDRGQHPRLRRVSVWRIKPDFLFLKPKLVVIDHTWHQQEKKEDMYHIFLFLFFFILKLKQDFFLERKKEQEMYPQTKLSWL